MNKPDHLEFYDESSLSKKEKKRLDKLYREMITRIARKVLGHEPTAVNKASLMLTTHLLFDRSKFRFVLWNRELEAKMGSFDYWLVKEKKDVKKVES